MRRLLCLLAVMFTVTLSADLPSFTSARTHTDWIAHLDRFAAAHPELTNAQKAVVADGRELLEGGLLGRMHSADTAEAAEARRAFESFQARAMRTFSNALFNEGFTRPAQPGTKSRAMIPDCDCDPNAGDCPGDCVTGSCRVMPEGCGLWGQGICWGRCW